MLRQTLFFLVISATSSLAQQSCTAKADECKDPVANPHHYPEQHCTCFTCEYGTKQAKILCTNDDKEAGKLQARIKQHTLSQDAGGVERDKKKTFPSQQKSDNQIVKLDPNKDVIPRSNGGRGNGRNNSNNGRNSNSDHNTIAHRDPVRNVREVGGSRVATDGRGRIREIDGRDSHGHELAVHRDLRGGARFEATGAGGRRIVAFGQGRGFTERRFVKKGGHVYVQRTYVSGGQSYAYAYRSYYYQGLPYYDYVPTAYYLPIFYGWAYNPWTKPVIYDWGWTGNPWYERYDYYFTPYPSYPSASLWLTDYLLAESLKTAYVPSAEANAMQQDANVAADNDNKRVLSPEVKQMLADEVKRQLDAERNAAANHRLRPNDPIPANANNPLEEAPPALDRNQRVFVVTGNVDLVVDSGECIVTAGDVLVRSGEANGSKTSVSVISSKKGDCTVGTSSDIAISELQEMNNRFRERIDSGLQFLANNSGRNGLPKAPDANSMPGEVPAPHPDLDAPEEVRWLEKGADILQQQVYEMDPRQANKNKTKDPNKKRD